MTSTFSPEFRKAMTLRVGPLILLVRLVVVLGLAPIGLIGVALKWLGDLGARLVEWHEDWTAEVCSITAPPVWSEINRLRGRCERVEEDAATMRSICRNNDADIKRAREVCINEDLKDVKPWPVIQWPASVSESEQSPTPST